MSVSTLPRPYSRAESRLPTLYLVQTPRPLRRVARLLTIALVLLPFALALVPWQQNVTGSGRVVAYAPVERQQTIDARIDGRVVRWWVVEGSPVKKGDPIVEITDNDPEILHRLREQRDAAALKLEAARSKEVSARSVVAQFEDAGKMAVSAAEQMVAVSVQKVQSEEQELAAARVAQETDTLQVRRVRQLEAEGLASRRDRELADQKYLESSAKVRKAEAYLSAAKSEQQYKIADRDKVRAEAQAKIDSARVYLQEARGEAALATKDLSELDVKLARQTNQKVVAPRDGTVLRIVGGQDAEYVKAGDPLVVLVPDTTSRAVELWVDGNDAPLISPGRHVRLQFEGWPAVQFAGWPSVAVGSFGGEVVLVDSHDDGKGKFRILVVPDDEVWPSGRFLRQGVRAKGWVLLDRVKLGYEIWRRLNGFPQSIGSADDKTAEVGKTDKKSKPKLPK